MSNLRFFSGGRSEAIGKVNKMIRRVELRKGGKLQLTSQERYKMIVKAKMEEHRLKSQLNPYSAFGANGGGRQMSKKAEQALKQMAARKAAKEAKKLNRMVVIKPRHYGQTGSINKKGIVYDHVNNMTMKVNRKNGKITTMTGGYVGKYKPKSMFHDGLMTSWIKKYSPYHIQLQKYELQRQLEAMQQMQAQGAVTIHGVPLDSAMIQQYINQLQDAHGNLVNGGGHVQYDAHGNAMYGAEKELNSIGRTNADVTAWGVRSGNVWGTFGENAWGGFQDNVWGGTNNNIWGGIGDPGHMWRAPSRRIFSSNVGGKNHLAVWAGSIAQLFGFRGGRNANGRGRNGGSGGTGAAIRFATAASQAARASSNIGSRAGAGGPSRGGPSRSGGGTPRGATGGRR